MSAHQAGATSLTQQSENFGYSAVRLRRIAKLQFGIINPAELVSTMYYCRRVLCSILRHVHMVTVALLVGSWRMATVLTYVKDSLSTLLLFFVVVVVYYYYRKNTA